jgi:hypothetical protein
MADKIVPIIYIGGADSWFDNLYGTGLTWTKGGFQNVPGHVAYDLLRHPEFKDGRVGKLKDRDIDATKPEKPEVKDEPPLVNLEAMTKDNIAQYAKRNFNLELDDGMKKADMVELVRRQMGTTMPVRN